jgi:hypothetical protein
VPPPETPGMTKEEVDRFLESKLMLQMSTIDEQGESNIQPVWFYYIVMEKEKKFSWEHTISYCHSQGKLYSRSNTKLAEINAPIIIPRRLTTLLSTIDIPLSRIIALLQCIALFSKRFLQCTHLYFA